jgi:hypothetical protein
MTRFFPPPQLSAIIAWIDALPCGVDLMSERDHAVPA